MVTTTPFSESDLRGLWNIRASPCSSTAQPVCQDCPERKGEENMGRGRGEREAHEVGDLDSALLLPVAHDEDVARLEVAVDDPVCVQVLEPIEHLPHDGLEDEGVEALARELVAVELYHLVEVVLRVVKG